MPAVQTTYPTTHLKGAVGAWVNMENWNGISRLCETVAGIGFGLAVSRGVGEKGIVIGGALPGFMGVSLRDITLVMPQGGVVDKYPRYANVGVGTLGKIWVAPDAAVLIGGDVYYVQATGVFTAAAGAGIVGPVVGAKYESAATANNLAILSLGIQR